MGSFKSRPLSSLLLLGLLAWIAYVLIAPEIDLPDTAFQRDGSPLAIHARVCHAPQRNANLSAPKISFPSAGASYLAPEIFYDKAVEVPSAPPRILRC
jgi:hypothetical protein